MQCKNNKRFLVNGKLCLITQPEIASIIGKTPSMFLQQVHYWITCNNSETGRVVDNRRWIYNSAKEWAAQLCLSERQVTRVVSALKNIGVLLVDRLSHIKSDRTNWYSIDYQKLESLLPGLELNIKPVVVPKKEILPPPTDKMSEPFGHNGGMYNKEAETTSEINLLSEEKAVVEDTSLQQVHVVQEDVLLISQNSNTNTPPELSDSPTSSTSTSSPNTLASDLLEIWNQTVGQRQGEEGNLIQLTKKRAQYLVAAFKFRFESNLSKWKQFCQQVTSSDFLMGKIKSTFRASLDWVLKFDIIQRILEGDFGVNKTPCVDEEAVSLKTEAITQTIETSGEGEPIKRLRRSILRALGEQTYQSWFADMPMTQSPPTKGGRGIQLHTKSRFACDYVQTNYLDKLTSLTDCELVVVLESSNNHQTSGGNGLVLEQGLQ